MELITESLWEVRARSERGLSWNCGAEARAHTCPCCAVSALIKADFSQQPSQLAHFKGPGLLGFTILMRTLQVGHCVGDWKAWAYFQVDRWLFFKSQPLGFLKDHCWGEPSFPDAFLIYYDLIISAFLQPAPCPKCCNVPEADYTVADLMFPSHAPLNPRFLKHASLFSQHFFFFIQCLVHYGCNGRCRGAPAVNKNTLATRARGWQEKEVKGRSPPHHQASWADSLGAKDEALLKGRKKATRPVCHLRPILSFQTTTAQLVLTARQSAVCFSGWGVGDLACQDEAASTCWWVLSQTSNGSSADLHTTCLCCLVSSSLLLFEADAGRQIGKYRSGCAQ